MVLSDDSRDWEETDPEVLDQCRALYQGMPEAFNAILSGIVDIEETDAYTVVEGYGAAALESLRDVNRRHAGRGCGAAARTAHVTRSGAYERGNASIGTASDAVRAREGMTRGERVPRKPFDARTAHGGWDARLRPDARSRPASAGL